MLNATDVTAVETAAPHRRALAARGFNAAEEIEGDDYDAVMLFNLLDRSVFCRIVVVYFVFDLWERNLERSE